MEKLIITIAPTGNVPTKSMTPYVPVTADEIARDISACYAQGAAVAHIHARDEEGKPASELKYFAEIVQAIDQTACPVIKQISTGARAGKTAEARAAALVLNPVSASLSTGSSNFPNSANLNEPALVEYLAKTMLARNIKPEIEVFDAAMIHNALELKKKGLIKDPLQFNLVLGVKGSLPATPKNLFFLVESLPPDAVWSVSVIGPQHVNLSVMAMSLGGHVRVGVEDNIYYAKGILATNAALVERIANIAKAMGREIATPEDVKRIWGIDQ
ncbi:3-keto-5-aminohexanoate cleavage protein [Sporomusa sphaeroides DSM 2875]|uniref:3-keto-5-aminohexanoate cleavage protein n=1 Tax=Sporomusa sphaeroides TaxID=47679 RepID=UPI002030F1F2|nr:3-keto-5-aminohexanoate cleavage protein [Sporomusa sphaeroides]MCM0759819.1 3-keto-5-aminohexanoate cleavage protein [Sporomusa sphaeroides DSM 2875]